jgi:predicted enzyme related to lactoylglutathione lyase
MKRRTIVLASLLLYTFGCSEDRSSLAEHAERAEGKDLSAAIPIFTVDNLRASQAYYRDVLGFTVEWEDGEPPDFGAVTRGDAVVFMCQRCQGHPGAWIMMFTPDVDRLYAELERNGAIITRPPTNMPWRLREMLVHDPDGNTMRFASPIEH